MAEGLQAFHFLRPWWLLGALPALVLAFIWAQRRWRHSPWQGAVAPELLAVLLERSDGASRRYAPWVAAAALMLGAAALAGPTWQRLPQPVEQKSDGLVILLDLSLSMYAQDLTPSRLTRASQKITDVLRQRREGFTALVAYAGDAHIVAPLTDDVRTIENLLTALHPAMMPVPGSKPGSALEQGLELLANAAMEQGRLLLVTDGVDAFSEVTDRCSRRHPLSILGVGTAADALIPLDAMGRPGEYLTTRQGAPVRAPLDADRLATLAQLCHGRYRSIEIDDSDIAHLLSTPLPGKEDNIDADREFDVWADVGHWGALALLPFLLAGFRRGFMAAVVIGLCLSLAPSPAVASLWEDLWRRRDQQGYEALNEGRPEAAAGLFQDSQWRNTAKYRSQDYASAADGWRSSEGGPTERYNLGNALAQLGEYEAAIAAYEQALEADPALADAAFNKALLEQWLEQQQTQQQDQGSSGNQGEQGQDKGASQSADQGGGQTAADATQDAAAEDAQQAQQQGGDDAGEPVEAETLSDGNRDEHKEALEQWLRRVPDDPGGLLRRKFQYETNQRLRRGDYQNRQQEKAW